MLLTLALPEADPETESAAPAGGGPGWGAQQQYGYGQQQYAGYGMQQPGYGGYGSGAPVQPGAMVPYGLNGGFNRVLGFRV